MTCMSFSPVFPKKFGAKMSHETTQDSPSTVFLGHPRDTMATFFSTGGFWTSVEAAEAPTS